MKITIAAATPFEIQEEVLQSSTHRIQFLYTGVGILSSAVSLTKHVFQQKPELIIQAGIAGCFDTKILLGDVVIVDKEYVGDTGVWENNNWKDLFDMNLLKDDEMPFTNKSLANEKTDEWNVLRLTKVTGVTVNEITTDERRCNLLQSKYAADIESMEGASLHYVCTLFSVPFIQVRSLSNYVGERNKSNWKLKESIANVNEAVKKMISML